jgi:hypothetical protein
MRIRVQTSVLVLIALVLAAGCSLTPPAVPREYPVISSEAKTNVDDSTVSRQVIFNASSPVMFTGTGRLNVLLNGKGAAQLDIWEYIELLVPQGKYRVDLLHHDVASFSSSHEIDLDALSAYLEVKATIVSNSARVVIELPGDFKENYYKK